MTDFIQAMTLLANNPYMIAFEIALTPLAIKMFYDIFRGTRKHTNPRTKP